MLHRLRADDTKEPGERPFGPDLAGVTEAVGMLLAMKMNVHGVEDFQSMRALIDRRAANKDLPREKENKLAGGILQGKGVWSLD